MDAREPISELVDAYWLTTAKTLHMASEDAFMGSDDNGMLTPPAWSFGDIPEAEKLLEMVLDGRKVAMSSSYDEYVNAGVEIPTEGELSIICNHEGRPRALLRVTEVRVTEFDQVGEDIAAAEGEDSLEKWRKDHEELFGGRPKVVTEFFTVLDKAK